MTDTGDRFGDLLERLQQSGLEFIVCGGMAAVIHGVERTTLDLDISVSLRPSNIPNLVRAAEASGLVPRVPVDPFMLGDADTLHMMIHEKQAIVFTFIHPKDPFIHLDVFLVPELRYENLVDYSEIHSFRNNPLRVLSAQKLLELKESIDPPRPKDLMDILVLREIVKHEQNG